jgi:hypothetical protein
MPVRCLRTAMCVAATVVGLFSYTAPAAQAAPKAWAGRYVMVTYASQKGGTSMAVRQRESDFSAAFEITTNCSAGTCVATVTGPASSNPTVPNPQRFTWDGQQWKSVYEWVWQCSLGDDSAQSQWSPAQSWTFYTPQPDGSLQGMWHTDIASGACRGSVVMPIAAVPA